MGVTKTSREGIYDPAISVSHTSYSIMLYQVPSQLIHAHAPEIQVCPHSSHSEHTTSFLHVCSSRTQCSVPSTEYPVPSTQYLL